jgi:hypothetical protein
MSYYDSIQKIRSDLSTTTTSKLPATLFTLAVFNKTSKGIHSTINDFPKLQLYFKDMTHRYKGEVIEVDQKYLSAVFTSKDKEMLCVALGRDMTLNLKEDRVGLSSNFSVYGFATDGFLIQSEKSYLGLTKEFFTSENIPLPSVISSIFSKFSNDKSNFVVTKNIFNVASPLISNSSEL